MWEVVASGGGGGGVQDLLGVAGRWWAAVVAAVAEGGRRQRADRGWAVAGEQRVVGLVCVRGKRCEGGSWRVSSDLRRSFLREKREFAQVDGVF